MADSYIHTNFIVPRGSKAIPIIAPATPKGESLPRLVANLPTPPSSRGANSTASPSLVHTSSPQHSRDNEREDWGFDVYARPFVPQALTIINLQPSTIINTDSSREISFPSYTQTFAGSSFLPKRPILTQYESGQGTSSTPPELTADNYEAYFQHHLSTEIQAQEKQNENFALYKVLLGIVDNVQGICNLHVPGLREDSPLVEMGDIVQLRQLRLDQNGNPLWMDIWLSPGGGASRGGLCPGWTGYQFNALVWAVNRTLEMVYLKIHGLKPESMVFNVVFPVQQRRVQALRTALVMIQNYLRNAPGSTSTPGLTAKAPTPLCQQPAATLLPNGDAKTGAAQQPLVCNGNPGPPIHQGNQWIRRMLFPVESDGDLQRELHKIPSGRNLFDPKLNFEQLKAVDSICRSDYGTVPFLISGPPGTGKTKTLVETALQLLATTRVSHILVCAPSDPAADTLALRLRAHLGQQKLLRLNGPSRSFLEVPEGLLPFSYIENDVFSIPPMQTLMRYEIVVTTCRDAAVLVSARVTNDDLYSLETGLQSALCPGTLAGKDYDLHWGALLMDEAAQAIEPEAAIPLTVVAPPTVSNISLQPQFVMAGDHKQLGPRTASKSPAIETSLFERLFHRPLYSDHPFARNKGKPSSAPPVLTKAMLPIIRAPFANLIRNYRSHPAILAVPSSLFYHDTLIPEATDADSLLWWPGWQGRRWPVLFACNTSLDEIERDGGGWYNPLEAGMACDYALALFRNAGIAQKDICIMSPFSAQVKALRSKIRQPPYSLWEVNIGPTEAYQGLESRIVIVSLFAPLIFPVLYRCPTCA